MSRSRIAIFSGFTSRYGAPLYSNPRPRTAAGGPFGMRSYGAPLGRRAYTVPPERGYGPVRSPRGRRPVVRAGYRVKRMVDTPAMKKAQARMKRASKKCSLKASKRGARKGTFKSCMRTELKKKR